MTSTSGKVSLFRILRIIVPVVWACLCVSVLSLAQHPRPRSPQAGTKTFELSSVIARTSAASVVLMSSMCAV